MLAAQVHLGGAVHLLVQLLREGLALAGTPGQAGGEARGTKSFERRPAPTATRWLVFRAARLPGCPTLAMRMRPSDSGKRLWISSVTASQVGPSRWHLPGRRCTCSAELTYQTRQCAAAGRGTLTTRVLQCRAAKWPMADGRWCPLRCPVRLAPAPVPPCLDGAPGAPGREEVDHQHVVVLRHVVKGLRRQRDGDVDVLVLETLAGGVRGRRLTAQGAVGGAGAPAHRPAGLLGACEAMQGRRHTRFPAPRAPRFRALPARVPCCARAVR